ncbi:MAG: DUF2695 domain-containing protein [Kofleriaceae bacterium]
MDKATRKLLRRGMREQEREASLRALPLAIAELEAMFDHLDAEIPRRGCDHTRRLTKAWLAANGHDAEPVLTWLDAHAGNCDCMVVMNATQELERAKSALGTLPD